MKRIWILFITLALGGFVLSCTELEPTPKFKASTAGFSANASTETIAMAAPDSLDDAVTFTWTDPGYAVGLDNSKFSVLIGAEDANFVSFSKKEFNGVLSGSLMAKEINAIALRNGGVIGVPITLDVKVVASQSNNNEPKESGIIQLSVTPYGDLVLEASEESVICSALTPSDKAIEFTWNSAFAGYSGVKKYWLEYAAGGSDFDPLTSVEVTTFSKSFTHFQLNNIALSNGVAALDDGEVSFRIKAVNESGTVLYSNTMNINITTYLAFNSIGIIGDATAGGWDVDTDMRRPDPTKPTEWTATLYLIGGKNAKFRADDAWATNWGSSAYPTGTGVQDGANVPIPSDGYYKVEFNVASGAYSFTKLTTTTFTAVSLIGDQSSWGSDIVDLTKNGTDDQIWTGTVHLTPGGVKFRANHAWATNWGPSGGSSTLSGYGVQDGGNITITTEGDYFVYINVASGEYFLGKADRATAYSDIGVIGSGTAGGWSSDTNLVRNPANPFKWSGTITLTDGEAKFRADNDWAVNWGSSGFPSGVGTQNGANVPVTAGTYVVSFNTSTGEYTFLK